MGMCVMFSENLKKLRRSKGMTQSQLASNIGVSPSTVGMYEQGRREPDSKILKKLCMALNTTTDFLLDTYDKYKVVDLEVNKAIDEFTETLKLHRGLMFNGKPISMKDREKIVHAIKIATAVAVSSDSFEED